MWGLQELLILILIIIVLSSTGLWPVVMRGLRELRGERFAEDEPRGNTPPARGPDADLCYRLLGISRSSSWEEIERAYRTKAKIHHPDHGGDEDTMRTLNEAYHIIKQLRKR